MLFPSSNYDIIIIKGEKSQNFESTSSPRQMPLYISSPKKKMPGKYYIDKSTRLLIQSHFGVIFSRLFSHSESPVQTMDI
jgi:hypothetical protein